MIKSKLLTPPPAVLRPLFSSPSCPARTEAHQAFEPGSRSTRHDPEHLCNTLTMLKEVDCEFKPAVQAHLVFEVFSLARCS